MRHIVCVAITLLAGSFAYSADDPPKEESKDIPFKVVEEWGAKGNLLGAGYAIVIDPKYRNETDMKKLGDILKEKHSKDKNINVMIYDNEKVAKMRKNIPLKGAGAKLYDKHNIGHYLKLRNGKNDYSFGITDKGFSGKTTEISY